MCLCLCLPSDDDYEEVESNIFGFLLAHHRPQPPVPTTPVGLPLCPPIPLAPPPPLPPKRTKLFRKGGAGVDAGEKLPLPPRNIPRNPSEVPTQMKPNFYFRLALQALKCLSGSLVFSTHQRLHEYLTSSVSTDHLSVVAWLFVTGHGLVSNRARSTDLARLGSIEELVSGVTELLHEMVVGGLVSHDHHGMLLRELGLHTGCWPLFISQQLLSLLARLLLCRLHAQASPQDDPLALNIWKGYGVIN